MLVVTYEGSHLHGPQPLFPRRQWSSVGLSRGAAGPAASNSKQQARASSSPAAPASDDGGVWPPIHQMLQTTTRDADAARGGPTAAAASASAAGEMPGPLVGRAGDAVSQPLLALTAADSCDNGSTASVPAPRAAAPFQYCDDSPPTTWSCPDFPFAWSPEAPLLL